MKNWNVNKYVITLLVAAAIYLLVGEQSVIRQIRRNRQIHQIEAQIATLEQDTEESQQILNHLQNTDSLERFAREHYYMHTANEDVYVIEH